MAAPKYAQQAKQAAMAAGQMNVNQALPPMRPAEPDVIATPLASAVLRLRNATESVGGLVSTMNERLRPVISRVPIEGAGEAGRENDGTSDLVVALNDIANQIEAHAAVGFSVLRAVEV